MIEAKSAIDELLTDEERRLFIWLQGGVMTPRRAFSFVATTAAASLFLNWMAIEAQAFWLTMFAEVTVLIWFGFAIFMLIKTTSAIRGILAKYEAFVADLAARQCGSDSGPAQSATHESHTTSPLATD